MKLPSPMTLARYFVDFWRSTAAVALLALRPHAVYEYEVTVPMPACSPTRLYLIANLISYTPGTLAIGTTAEGDLIVHVITDEAREESELRAELQRFVEAWT